MGSTYNQALITMDGIIRFPYLTSEQVLNILTIGSEPGKADVETFMLCFTSTDGGIKFNIPACV